MKKLLLNLSVVILLLLEQGSGAFAQVSINTDNSLPDNSAMLDVKSSAKGFLPPRMTQAEMVTIPNPAEGLMVFCTDCGLNGTGVVVVFMNGAWSTLAVGCIFPPSPETGIHAPSPVQIIWNWNTVSGATGYKWGTTNVVASATDMGTATTKTESGLTCNTAYTRYAWAYSACGNSTPVTLTQLTSLDPPAIPTAGAHEPAQTQIIWNWNTVSGATGYKWSTTNDYATATDMGTATTKTETGLICNTAYTRYAWAYSACGNSVSLTLIQTTSACTTVGPCPGIPTVNYEGRTYNTVQIGTQCWFKENLNTGTRLNGGVEQTNNSTIEKYCMNNLESNCDIYGALYQWNEMMQYATTEGSQGICPGGWHIPSDAEYTALLTFLGGEAVAGGKMKEAGTSHWASPNTGATNSSGFTALPGGYFNYSNVSFYYLTYSNYLWSSTQSNLNDAWMRYLDNGDEDVNHQAFAKVHSLSVRCLAESCTSAPTQPTSGTHVPAQTQIIWNWNTVSGATGYKWNTTNDFATATDMGTATTKTETGLTCNTPYTRYAWAYNACGNSTALTMNQTTSNCSFACGSPIIINHVTGAVAPVDKTVTYGTVTNIPGELTKCWITSNLGADHQATAVSDNTEASAGWYWQFNRKQGYKHDGSTRTPNTAWISSISETSDWIAANDPCNIELGTTWRIPTYTEWYNVDNTGGWTNWNDPWGSGLKLHGAGFLLGSSGSLDLRGSYGAYSGSTQGDVSGSSSLIFDSGTSYISPVWKTYGCTLRCLRD